MKQPWVYSRWKLVTAAVVTLLPALFFISAALFQGDRIAVPPAALLAAGFLFSFALILLLVDKIYVQVEVRESDRGRLNALLKSMELPTHGEVMADSRVLKLLWKLDEGRREFETLASEFSDRVNAICATLPHSVFMIDESGCFMELLAGSEGQKNRFRKDGYAGSAIEKAVPREVGSRLRAAIFRAIKYQLPQTVSYDYLAKGRHVWFDGLVAPLKSSEAGNGRVVFTAINKTDLMEAQEQHEAARRQVEALQAGGDRKPALNAFLDADILRAVREEMLYLLQSLAALLDSATVATDPAERARIMELARLATCLATRLSENPSGGAQTDSYPEPLFLGGLLMNAAGVCTAGQLLNCEIQMEGSASELELEGDFISLHRLLCFLLQQVFAWSGACKHVVMQTVAHPGSVEIRIEPRQRDEVFAEDQELFDDDTGRSAAVRTMIERMATALGASVEEFKVDQQLAFKVRLPTAAAQTQPEMGRLSGSAGSIVADVLVVEDNPAAQQVMRTLLTRLGCKVTIVEDGEQAVAATLGHPFELIFMDCSLPHLDGWKATTRIREACTEGHKPYIIATTAHVLPVDRMRCKEAGMDAFLPKPVSKESLFDALERYLEWQRVRN